ncbi:MAG: hypothetical protein GY847_05175 [Proteobacteria bacterium]|nr:hypothetical protein [Pseudomonadota bacterium]
MNRAFLLSLLIVLVSPSLWSQNFTDGFDGSPVSDFAASSAAWDAVWDGDGWTTENHAGGVSPSTNKVGQGKFGEPADVFENAIVTGGKDWRDYSVEARFYVDDVDAIGLVFRYTSPDSFYVLVISRNTMPSTDGQVDYLLGPETRLYRVFEGKAEQLLEPSPKEAYLDDPSLTQSLRVEVGGTLIQIWLGTGEDGIDPSSPPMAAVDDVEPAPTVGQAGLYAFAMGGAGTYFDNFEVRPLDSDRDGRSNDEEREAGTDPNDADSDDDGYPDGSEYAWLEDSDSDGLINALDWDSDNDGLPDGLELGYTAPNPDTDLSAGHFIADEHPASTTKHLNPDSDLGGALDGQEDLNKNGRFDPDLGETDPNDYNDDDLYKDAGPDIDIDTDIDIDADTDADTDTDSDIETDTEDALEDDTDVDANTPDGEDQSDAGWGSIYGGPSCNCRSIGIQSNHGDKGFLMVALGIFIK